MTARYTATIPRPMGVRLVVKCDDGTEWDATEDDLARFSLADQGVTYLRFRKALVEIMEDAGLLDRDVTDLELNPIRYLVESCIYLDPTADQELGAHLDVANLERRLRAQKGL